jgi:hypothetical protein
MSNDNVSTDKKEALESRKELEKIKNRRLFIEQLSFFVKIISPLFILAIYVIISVSFYKLTYDIELIIEFFLLIVVFRASISIDIVNTFREKKIFKFDK